MTERAICTRCTRCWWGVFDAVASGKKDMSITKKLGPDWECRLFAEPALYLTEYRKVYPQLVLLAGISECCPFSRCQPFKICLRGQTRVRSDEASSCLLSKERQQ